MTPLRMPSDGSMPTPMMRNGDCSRRIRIFRLHAPDQRADFGSANVYTDNDLFHGYWVIL